MKSGRADNPNVSRTRALATIANATLGFTLEMAMVAALCYWGFTTGGNVVARIVLGVGAPVIAGVLWWLFLAGGGPKYSTPTFVQVALKLALFGATALALYGTGHSTPGLAFATLSVVTVVVETATK